MKTSGSTAHKNGSTARRDIGQKLFIIAHYFSQVETDSVNQFLAVLI